MMKRWNNGTLDESVSAKLVAESDITPLCADVLSARGIKSIEDAAKLIYTDELESPFAVADMKEAADIINEAIETGRKICIYGDYDCDGITSTVMLYSYLECLGADVSYYIPERSEGYGLNMESVRKIAESGTELIITVDNGISAINEANLIEELGMELVITDHHQPGNILPKASAIVNPHRKDCDSSFKYLCGAGVVLKLIAAMDGGSYEMAVEQFWDLAAIGTVGDIVSLTGENRYIVQNGINFVKNTERVGLIELMKNAGTMDENGECRRLTSETIAFSLVPRINASGRFGSPRQAFELLMCEDPEKAEMLASELTSLNNRRKETEEEIMQEIYSVINKNPSLLSQRVLVFCGKGWHHGVIGIVASKVLEKYGKPCFIISCENGEARGSARSFGEFSIFECLTYCSDVLIKFGGHKGAGGFSLKPSDTDEFNSLIQKYALENHNTMPVYSIKAEKILKPSDINVKNVEGLDILEPFGEENEKPLFILSGAVVENIIPLAGGAHTKLKLNYGGIIIYAVMFRVRPDELNIKAGEKCDFIGALYINDFRGQKSVEFNISDYRKSGINQNSYFAADDAYEKYIRGESLPEAYYRRMCPDRDELVKVYNSINEDGISFMSLFLKNNSAGFNLCKLKICIDIFNELGIVYFDYALGKASKIKVNKKVNLEDSNILRGLRKWELKVTQ